MKKYLKSVIALLCLTMGFTSCADKKAAPVEEQEEELTALDFAQTLGIGWNLGNNLDAWNGQGIAEETVWKNGLATQAAFDAVAKAGFKSVRIPCTWLGHFGEAPD